MQLLAIQIKVMFNTPKCSSVHVIQIQVAHPRLQQIGFDSILQELTVVSLS